MRFVLIMLAVLIYGSISAQDLIVRITGDTLHVKVDSQNDTFVYYISNNSKRGEREVISRKEIAQILYNYENPDGQLKRKSERKTRDYRIFQFYGQLSGYYLPNDDIPEGDLEEYYEDLQFGSGYQIGVNYFINKRFGIGLTYALSKFNNSVDVKYQPLPTTPTLPLPLAVYGKLSDDLRLNYFGASAIFRFYLGESETNFSFSAGVGINYYRNDARIIHGYNLRAYDVGFHAIGGYNLSLGGGLSIPVTLGYLGNTVGNISLEVDDNMLVEIRESLETLLSEGNNFSVARVFVGVGLSFAF